MKHSHHCQSRRIYIKTLNMWKCHRSLMAVEGIVLHWYALQYRMQKQVVLLKVCVLYVCVLCSEPSRLLWLRQGFCLRLSPHCQIWLLSPLGKIPVLPCPVSPTTHTLHDKAQSHEQDLLLLATSRSIPCEVHKLTTAVTGQGLLSILIITCYHSHKPVPVTLS